MNALRFILLVKTFVLGLGVVSGQGFVNLDFESATIRTNREPGGDTYRATVPGWGVFGFPYGSLGEVWFNTFALDAPAVTLHGRSSSFAAIQGNYSVLLQGGSLGGGLMSDTNGASVFQTGQAPITSQSLIYLGGGAIRVSFSGQALSSIALRSTPNYTE